MTEQVVRKPRTYQHDREESDQYIPVIRQILGPLLLSESSFEVDTQEAADMVFPFVLRGQGYMIACRVRRYDDYFPKYSREFTLRKRRDSGHHTELSKVLAGSGDMLFYGFGKHIEGVPHIPEWFLINLHSFRFLWKNCQGQFRHGEKDNGDGTYFEWFDVSSFPTSQPAILVASSRPQQFQTYTDRGVFDDQMRTLAMTKRKDRGFLVLEEILANSVETNLSLEVISQKVQNHEMLLTYLLQSLCQRHSKRSQLSLQEGQSTIFDIINPN